jgi:hypothetical protein
VAFLMTTINGPAIPVTSSDFMYRVALGEITSHSYIAKFGRNPDIAATPASTPEDVWSAGGVYTGHPTQSETLEIYSSGTDAADDVSPAGTGAHTVRVEGLGDDWTFKTADVTMNGTTPVTIPGLWRRANRAYVLTAGTDGHNAGDIIVRHTTTTANVFIHLPALFNQTLITAYTVPAGKTGYLMTYGANMSRASGAAGSATISLRAREPSGVFRARFVDEMSTGLGLHHAVQGSTSFPEMTDIKARIDAVSDNGTVVSAHFTLVLIDD